MSQLRRWTISLFALAALLGCQAESANESPTYGDVAGELSEDPVLREQLIYGDESDVKVVKVSLETVPVQSLDDAADDPAIWIHKADPAKSLVLGTDKKSGIGVYNLAGEQIQFLPLGLPNNIDIRQNVNIDGWQGDIAAASNRDGDVISLLSVSEQGVALIGSTPASLNEPYGFCLGTLDAKVIAFVTYKTGQTVAHHIQQVAGAIQAPVVGQVEFASQLEGCVVDDASGRIYVGEEETGIWTASLAWQKSKLVFSKVESIDNFASKTGIVADIEGLSLYLGKEGRYLIASSQGNDSYAVYDADNYQFRGRFRVGANGAIDGSQETDGLETTSVALGPDFPSGLLVVQDGFNGAGSPQNFKLVDWRHIEVALGL